MNTKWINASWINARTAMWTIGVSLLLIASYAFFFISDKPEKTVVPVIKATDTITGSDFFLTALVTSIIACGLWLWITYAYSDKTKTRAQRFQGYKHLSWILAITVGIPVFHWLFWSTKPELWNSWFESTRFWPINFAVVLTVLFLGQKGGLPRLVGLAIGIYLIVFGIVSLNDLDTDRTSVATLGQISHLPAEIVLPIIADCESGNCTPGSGRQFDKNGNVVTNTNTNGTVDKGKWQINSIHDKELEKLQIDIETETGNKQFARILYERNELSDWQASRHRWEPKLMALGRKSYMPIADTGFTANVLRPGQPAEAVMDLGWCMKARGDGNKFDTNVEWRGQTKIRTFTAKEGVDETIVWIRYFPC